jgi:hypothetical protein
MLLTLLSSLLKNIFFLLSVTNFLEVYFYEQIPKISILLGDILDQIKVGILFCFVFCITES